MLLNFFLFITNVSAQTGFAEVIERYIESDGK